MLLTIILSALFAITVSAYYYVFNIYESFCRQYSEKEAQTNTANYIIHAIINHPSLVFVRIGQESVKYFILALLLTLVYTYLF